MGHVRLGKMPATLKWKQVIALLGDQPSIPRLADAVQRACDKSLSNAVRDPGFIEALWLMMQIPKAANSADFTAELDQIGIHVPENPRCTDLLAGFDAAIEKARSRSCRAVTDFSVLARNAAIIALDAQLQKYLPSLWEASVEDERTTFATFTSTERFGELAQRFFSGLLESHIQYFLDREIPRHIAPGSFIRSVADTVDFDDAVSRHCRESTFIMRAFARDWLGNNQFHLGKKLKREDVANFASYAFTKIKNELSIRGALQ